MPNEVFKNDFISNIKETVDVTLATDDDKQLEGHKKSFTNQWSVWVYVLLHVP